MNYLKTFEIWTTDVSGNFDINYGDKPEISDNVKYIVDYINEKFDSISDISFNEDSYRITFKDDDIRSIYMDSYKQEYDMYYISFKFSLDDGKLLITKQEYEYLITFFKELNKRFEYIKNKDKEDIALSKINPIIGTQKLYNM